MPVASKSPLVMDARSLPRPAAQRQAWIEHTATYTNKWDHPIWIGGYSQSHPFSAIEIRTSEDGNWHNYGLGYCGTGASELGIAPGASHSFRATLPERYVGQEFRVMLPYRTERNRQQWVQAASQARKLIPSGRRYSPD